MKPLALSLVVLALLCSTAARAGQYTGDCKHLSTAVDQMQFIVDHSWGMDKGNANILNAMIAQATSDLGHGKNWVHKRATIDVDPQTGDPVDCREIAAKHEGFLANYALILPKFSTATKSCVDVGNAYNGKCAIAVKAAFKARREFINASFVPFIQAERGAPLFCQASFNGYLNGAYLLSDGRIPEPCARPYSPGQQGICSSIPLKAMKKKANDACKDHLKKINDPLLVSVKNMCSPINKVRDKIDGLQKNFNIPNEIFFEASISAAVILQTLRNLTQVVCDVAPTPVFGETAVRPGKSKKEIIFRALRQAGGAGVY